MEDSGLQSETLRRKPSEDARRRRKHSNKFDPNENRLKSSDVGASSKSHEEIDPSMVFSWFSSVGVKAKQALQNLLLEEDSDQDQGYLVDSAGASDSKSLHDTEPSLVKPASRPSKSSFRYIYPNGVGKLRLHLISAQRLQVSDSAEGDHHAIVSMEEFDGGQSFVLSANDFQYAELKTKTVRSSATPVFDKKWTLGVPTYQACLKLALINSDDGVVGVTKIPIYALVMGKYGRSMEDRKKGKKTQEEVIPMRSPNDPTIVTGYFNVDMTFEEDVQALFLAKIPKRAKAPDDETLSVERLVKHIGRFQSLINLVGAIFAEYMDLMNWKDAIFTSTMLLVFVYTTLTINAEYALCCPVFLALCLFTRAYQRRVSGAYTKETIERMKPNNDPYRPIASLTLAVIETKYAKDPLAANSKVEANSDTTAVSLASLWGLNLSSAKPAPMHVKPFISVLYRPMRGDFLKLKKTKNEVVAENRTFLIGSVRGGEDIASVTSTYRHTPHTPVDTQSKDAYLHNILTPWPRPARSERLLSAAESGIEEDVTEDLAFVYPLLQPVWKNVIASHPQGDADDLNKIERETVSPGDKPAETHGHKPKSVKKNKIYVPWDENESEIILQFHRDKPSHGFMESLSVATNDIGTVVIPVRSLLEDSMMPSDRTVYFHKPSEDVLEVCQWYPVVPTVVEVRRSLSD